MAQDNEIWYPEAEKVCMNVYSYSADKHEKRFNRSMELVHLLHLDGFKLNKFESQVPYLADQSDEPSHSTEREVMSPSKE